MNGTTIVGANVLPNPGSAWKLEGGGNFSASGDQDLLFVNTSTDQVQIWVMNGMQVTSMQGPQSSMGASASSAATALSATPTLTEADAYYPATFAGSGGCTQNNPLSSSAVPSGGLLSSGQTQLSSGGGLLGKTVFA
jgi:hypothetical protein